MPSSAPIRGVGDRVGCVFKMDVKAHVARQFGESDADVLARAILELTALVSDMQLAAILRGVVFDGEVCIADRVDVIDGGGA